jgi:hypothetical protein
LTKVDAMFNLLEIASERQVQSKPDPLFAGRRAAKSEQESG